MIIFFAGLPGVGKSSLSKAVSENLGIHRYEVDTIRQELFPKLDPDYKSKLDNCVILSGDVDEELFKRAAADLRALSGKHEHVIVDDLLYKRHLREMIYEVADTHFGGKVVIWIHPDEALAKKRLAEDPREGHLLIDAVGTYEVFKGSFDPMEEADITFPNEKDLPEAVATLIPLIKERLG